MLIKWSWLLDCSGYCGLSFNAAVLTRGQQLFETLHLLEEMQHSDGNFNFFALNNVN